MSAWIPAPLRQLGQRLRGAAANQSELLAWFEDKARSRGYQLSDGQRRVIHCMAEQLAQLEQGQPQSLYLYGSVGRGKSLAAGRLLPGGAGRGQAPAALS